MRGLDDSKTASGLRGPLGNFSGMTCRNLILDIPTCAHIKRAIPFPLLALISTFTGSTNAKL